MVRNYKRRTMQGKTDAQTMLQAARCVKLHGVPRQQVSREYGIKYRTLSKYIRNFSDDDIYGTNPTPSTSVGYRNARNQVLPPLVEEKLVEYVMRAANIQFGLSTVQVRKMAYDIVKDKNIRVPSTWTEAGMAGTDWYGSFVKRHRAMQESLSRIMLVSKSHNYSQTKIDVFCNKLEALIKRCKFKVGNMWSMHEYGVSMMNVPNRVVVRGYGQSRSDQGLVTIAVSICADGDKAPPLFTRPTEEVDDKESQQPVKLSNWMDEARFLEYLQHFVSYTRCDKKNPCLLIIDKQCYLSIKAIDYAEEHGLVLLSFPQYCSHKLTPVMDNNFYQHFTSKINDICNKWFERNTDRPMMEQDIERMILKNHSFIFSINLIKAAFKNKGIHPLKKLVLTEFESDQVNQQAVAHDDIAMEEDDDSEEEQDDGDEERKLLLTKDVEKDKTREVDVKRREDSHWQQQDEVVVKVEDEVTEIDRPDDSDRFDYENNTTGAWSQDENCGDDTPTGGEEESNEPVVNLEIGGRGEEVVVPSLRMLQQRSPVASASAPAMSNMYPQQYCLRWKYHHSNLQTMFSQLLERQAYCDVTLACEGKTLRAHKVVLSACSTYFDTILSQYEEKDPIVIMRDVKFSDIKVLVEFMYKGEINIDHSRLSSLLKTAEDLHIKGLAEVSWRSDSAQNDLANSGHSPGAAPPGVEAVLREGDADDAPPPKQRRRGRPPLDDPPSAHDVFTPKITYITGNVGSEGTISAGQEQGRSFTLWKPPGVLVVKPTLARPFEYDKHSNQKEEMMSEGGDHESWGDDDLMIAENSENPIPGLSAYREDSVVDQDNKKLVANNPLNTNANNLSIPEQFRDVIKMNDYLTTGRRQEFWEEPFTRRVMDAIKSKELEMKTAAEILGVSYGTLYGRYRDSYGCLKHPYRVRDFWTEPGPAEVLAKLRRKEITLFRAAEFLNVTVHTLATYLSTLQGPDRISLTGDLGAGANIDGSSNDTDNNESMNDLIQKINANATAVTPTTSTPIKREGGGYIEVPNLMQKPAAAVLENNPDITIVKTEGTPTAQSQQATRKRDYSKLVSSNAENNNAKLMSGGAVSEQQVAPSGAQSVMSATLASSGAAKLDALSLNNDNGKP